MTTSDFYYKLRDRIIKFLDQNDPIEIIYIEKADLVSKGCSSESDFFIDYLPSVLDSVEKITSLDRELIDFRLRGKIVVFPGGSYDG
jgi:hypothetical protein